MCDVIEMSPGTTFHVNQGRGKISSFWSRDSLLAFVASFRLAYPIAFVIAV